MLWLLIFPASKAMQEGRIWQQQLSRFQTQEMQTPTVQIIVVLVETGL